MTGLKKMISKKHSCCKSGFTMLELIVVITIVSVIAGLALVSYNKTVEYTIERETLLHLRSIYVAMENYYSQHNEYPATAELDNATVINTTLGINLPDFNEGVDYECDVVDPNRQGYRCDAYRPERGNGNFEWDLYIVNDWCFGKARCDITSPECIATSTDPLCYEDGET